MALDTYIADDGDQCDSCGRALHDGELLLLDDSMAIRWRFCSFQCADAGVTNASAKARFIYSVIPKIADSAP